MDDKPTRGGRVTVSIRMTPEQRRHLRHLAVDLETTMDQIILAQLALLDRWPATDPPIHVATDPIDVASNVSSSSEQPPDPHTWTPPTDPQDPRESVKTPVLACAPRAQPARYTPQEIADFVKVGQGGPLQDPLPSDEALDVFQLADLAEQPDKLSQLLDSVERKV